VAPTITETLRAAPTCASATRLRRGIGRRKTNHTLDLQSEADLVRDGLATADPETVKAGGRMIEVIHVVITDAAWKALECHG